MPGQIVHVSDRELLLRLDGELPRERTAYVREHLADCPMCRERMSSLEEAMNVFERLRDRDFGGRIPSEAGPRALLRARLAQAASRQEVRWWDIGGFGTRIAVGTGFICAAVIVLAILGPIATAAGQRPNSVITPGETRPITLAEACRNRDAQVIARNISDEKRRAVLAEYGVRGNAGEFEVDYLITPDLGGADTVRNLWPQPYSAHWNARAKDRLEQRLHDLVCAGRIDLRTAQHEIASNWIEAYKSYVSRDSAH